MNDHLNFKMLLEKAIDFYEIYWDGENKYIRIEGYYYDEGQDNGKGTSRFVEYSDFKMKLIDFLNQIINNDDFYDDIVSDINQNIYDMNQNFAFNSMRYHFGKGNIIKELMWDELNMETEPGYYVNYKGE